MPQMFPMNWILIMYLITFLYLSFMFIMFFSYIPQTPSIFSHHQNTPLMWLW